VPRRWRWTSALRLCGAAPLLAALLAGCEPVRKALAPPAIVSDAANLVEPSQRAAIEEQHALLRADYGIDYRVETARGVGDLDRYAVERFASLSVGSAGRGGRGLLLVIDAESDELRVEVGRALEGAFPDAFVAYVEQRQMVPFFRAGRVGDGVLATTELLVGRLQREVARGGLGELPTHGSAGGGARTRARIDEPADRPARAAADVTAAETPEATVARYLSAMRARNADPQLDLYSSASRDLLAGMVMTPAQMDTLVETYRECRAEPARLDPTGSRAVLRHPLAQRRCAPWFLVREGARWRLDLATSWAVVRFGRDNSWHFARDVGHPYEFAFDDWRFDRNGFAREEPMNRRSP
jgi:uncharacterized protein